MKRSIGTAARIAAALAAALCVNAALAQTQPAPPPTARDERPYDAQLHRLAEILGALHYLRELCGADEGQQWREQMSQLIAAEGSTPLRRARLVENFNKGYRGYSRTYRSCNASAIAAMNRFLEQGAAITNVLIQDNR
jgi:uncharacterized protein (TIGR02301 family)